jgi:hypothetical protein
VLCQPILSPYAVWLLMLTWSSGWEGKYRVWLLPSSQHTNVSKGELSMSCFTDCR